MQAELTITDLIKIRTEQGDLQYSSISYSNVISYSKEFQFDHNTHAVDALAGTSR